MIGEAARSNHQNALLRAPPPYLPALQEEVYLQSARSAVLNVLDGYNATIIAYGQTGTGAARQWRSARENEFITTWRQDYLVHLHGHQ